MSELSTGRVAALLRLLSEAVEARSTPSQGNVGAALLDLGELARLSIPTRGALPLSDDQLFNEIDAVGTKHFQLAEVRRAVGDAVARVEPLSSREEIEVAVDHLCAVLNAVYFHAGLAFGITLADLKSL